MGPGSQEDDARRPPKTALTSEGDGMASAAGARVLIVEDDFQIASNLHTYLALKGFDVDAAYTGQAALHRCSVDRFDVVLLDIGLPGLDGLAFLQRLRGELRVGTLEFDRERGEVRVAGTPVRLTPKSMLLLELLLRKPGQLVRRGDIEATLWPDASPQADAMRSQIHSLRKALAEHGFDGLETVHGAGAEAIPPAMRALAPGLYHFDPEGKSLHVAVTDTDDGRLTVVLDATTSESRVRRYGYTLLALWFACVGATVVI